MKSFEGRQELDALREETSEMKDSYSPEEIKEYKHERVAEIKTSLQEQYIGVARCIDALHECITSNAESNPYDLTAIVQEHAEKYGFNEEQMLNLTGAIGKYSIQHRTVQNLRALYPDDSDIFKACFKSDPVGKIEIFTGPLSFYIRCYDQEDYIAAYGYGSSHTDTENLSKIRESAQKSGAAALRSVADPELKDLITIEKTSELIQPITRRVQQSFDMRQKTFSLPEENQDGINIYTKDGAFWNVLIFDDFIHHKKTFSVYVFDEKRVTTDIVEVVREEKNGVTQISSKGSQKPLEKFTMPLVQGEKKYGYLNVTDDAVNVVNTSDEALQMKYSELKTINIVDETRSKSFRAHEEQHVFNRLFVPNELPRKGPLKKAWDFLNKNPTYAQFYYMHELVRQDRKELGIDTFARDEILAYYKDGSDPKRIFSVLTTSSLYDYHQKFKESITQKIKKSSSYSQVASGVKKDPILWTDEEREQFEIGVFDEEYKEDIKKWTDVIVRLEKKGYNRKEVLLLLSQEPVNNWYKFEKRLAAREYKF